MAFYPRSWLGLCLFGLLFVASTGLEILITLQPDCSGPNVAIRVFTGMCTAHPEFGALLAATCTSEDSVRLTFYEPNGLPDSGSTPVCKGYRLGFNTVTRDCTPIGNVYAKILSGSCAAPGPVYLAATYKSADCDKATLDSGYWYTVVSNTQCLANNYFPGYQSATVTAPSGADNAININAFSDPTTCSTALQTYRSVTVNQCKPSTDATTSIKMIAAPTFSGVTAHAAVSTLALFAAGVFAVVSALS